MTRLLVLRLSALGDVIHTIPAVVALRESHPHTNVSWVVESPYRELVEIVAGVQAIPVRLKQWGRSPLASRGEMAEALRAMRGAETSIDFQGLMKSAMLGWFAGARTRVGFKADAIREKPALALTNRKVHVDTSRHVVEQNVQLAGLTRAGEGNWSEFASDPQRKLDAFAGKIVILPGAGKANKLWPAERFRELATRLRETVIAWGPNERDLADAIGGTAAPATDLRELAWLLANARVVIGADTGPLHLAAALGTKVVGLYGPTNPRRNGPYGQLDHCVSEFDRSKCMDSISVEQVMTMVERVAAE